MSLQKLSKYISVGEPWNSMKGSKYYNKINNIRNILMKLSGGNIYQMLKSVLTNDEACYFSFCS